jgi:hypothetical protein
MTATGITREGLTPRQDSNKGMTPRQERLAVLLAAALLLLFQLLDVFSTRRLLSVGGLEANPLARFLLAAGWLIVVKVVLVAALVLRSRRKPLSWGVIIGCWLTVGIYFAVVLGNVLDLAMVHAL